jgi:intein/homing endonuclease
MGDFSFKPLGDVKVGDEVIGWEQKPSTITAQRRNKGRSYTNDHLTRAKVLSVQRRQAPIVRITLESGRVLRCTSDHRWLSGSSKNKDYEYVEARPGRTLVYVVDSSPEHLTPEQERAAGYLAGIYDGEGTGSRISQHRSKNPAVYEAIRNALEMLGFPYKESADGEGFG